VAKVGSSISINKPIEEVFDYTASPFNGPAFIPNLMENTNINPEKPGVGQTFNWRFNLAGLDLTGNGVGTKYERPHLAEIKTTGGGESIWTYKFNEKDGGTKVTIEVEYKLPEGVLKKVTNPPVIDKLNQHSAEEMLKNLKVILEESS